MKKIFVCGLLYITGAIASEDWRTVADTKKAEKLARHYFWIQADKISKADIKRALQRFPEFLTWKARAARETILHVVSLYYDDPDLLRYLLGFNPDIAAQDLYGFTARGALVEKNKELFEPIFFEYEKKPWSHDDEELAEEEVVDLTVDPWDDLTLMKML